MAARKPLVLGSDGRPQLIQDGDAMLGNSIVSLTDGATITLDASLGNRFKVTLGGNRTLSFSNISDGQKIEVIVRQDGTGGRTLSYSGITIKWHGGSAPTLTTTASKADILVIWRDGSDYFGFVAQNF